MFYSYQNYSCSCFSIYLLTYSHLIYPIPNHPTPVYLPTYLLIHPYSSLSTGIALSVHLVYFTSDVFARRCFLIHFLIPATPVYFRQISIIFPSHPSLFSFHCISSLFTLLFSLIAPNSYYSILFQSFPLFTLSYRIFSLLLFTFSLSLLSLLLTFVFLPFSILYLMQTETVTIFIHYAIKICKLPLDCE